MPVYELITVFAYKVPRNGEVQDVFIKKKNKLFKFRKEKIIMKKLFTFTTIILSLTLLGGFNGIAGALDVKDQGEQMINVSQKQPLDKEALVAEGEKTVDEAEMQKEAEEMAAKDEMTDDTLKKMDENIK